MSAKVKSFASTLNVVRRTAIAKLKNKTGASMIIALLFFLVASVVGSVIVMAASANLSRTRERHAEEQAYLTLSSAALLLQDMLRDIRYTSYETRIVYDCYEVKGDEELDAGENYSLCKGVSPIIGTLTVDEAEVKAKNEIAKFIISASHAATMTKTEYNTKKTTSDVADYLKATVKIEADGTYGDMISDVKATLEMLPDTYDIKATLTIDGMAYVLVLTCTAQLNIEKVEGKDINISPYEIHGAVFFTDNHGHHVIRKYLDEQWEEVVEFERSTVTLDVNTYTVMWNEATIQKGKGADADK
jgi:hypothetical protein